MESETGTTCIICSQHKNNGIMVCSQFICEECESEIVRTDVKDAKYPFFINQMKQVWYKKDA